jgi:hypothetical protein
MEIGGERGKKMGGRHGQNRVKFGLLALVGLVLASSYVFNLITTTQVSANPFAASNSQNLTISWDGSSTKLCGLGLSQYAAIPYIGSQTLLDKGRCKGLLLIVESPKLYSALGFLRAHRNNYQAVIFDDYSSYYFAPYYANFSSILPVIPVEYYPSYDSIANKFSKTVIIPIGFDGYPNLTQSASIEQWNQTVVKYADQARSMIDVSTGKTFGFDSVIILVFEGATSFQSQWSESYINGTILASQKFNGLVVWNGQQFSA